MANIQTEHPEYVSKKATLQKYRLLYQGGEALRAEVSQYLLPRQKEPGTVYQERVNRFFYENYVGSIIDWYSATLFRREPMVILEGVQEASRSFYNEFAEDCDLKGTTISDFFRQQLVETLVGGASYIVVDFPRLEQHFMSRAEEDHYGASRAYLAAYTAEDLINWSHDQRGNLEWAVFRTQRLRADSAGEEHVLEQRWVYYDRTTYAVYRARANEKDQEPELVAKGLHGLARQRRVPVFELKVTDGLWLMNKAGLLQLEHMNKSNALSWALTMGLFSMPVVYSDRPFHQVLGESYYIQLAPEDRFGWTEPEGHVFQVAVDNLNRLKDEIYRTCFLMVQAGGPLSSGASQSGLSKQRDY
ncbi:MAG TPA: hypothetical protein DEH78_13430, partial [Solibacterales bacterium]|nr:hypothetical protein [Bryobacterales bacterium]